MVYGISRERVRQIEVRAFEKLQKAMRNAALEQRLTSQRLCAGAFGAELCAHRRGAPR